VITFLIDEYYLLFNAVRESLTFTTKLCTTKVEIPTDRHSSNLRTPNLTTPFHRVPEHGISLPQERERKLNSNSKDPFLSSEEQKLYKTNNGDASKIEYKASLNDKQLQKKMIIVAGGILLGLILTYLNYTLESEY